MYNDIFNNNDYTKILEMMKIDFLEDVADESISVTEAEYRISSIENFIETFDIEDSIKEKFMSELYVLKDVLEQNLQIKRLR